MKLSEEKLKKTKERLKKIINEGAKSPMDIVRNRFFENESYGIAVENSIILSTRPDAEGPFIDIVITRKDSESERTGLIEESKKLNLLRLSPEFYRNNHNYVNENIDKLVNRYQNILNEYDDNN